MLALKCRDWRVAVASATIVAITVLCGCDVYQIGNTASRTVAGFPYGSGTDAGGGASGGSTGDAGTGGLTGNAGSSHEAASGNLSHEHDEASLPRTMSAKSTWDTWDPASGTYRTHWTSAVGED